MAFVVSALTDYVENNKEVILKDIVLGAKSIQTATIQPGIKKDGEINPFSLSPAFQSGSSCGFNASGNATFSNRPINTGAIKVNMEFCEKDLLGKWTEYAVRFGADNQEFPFEQYITDELRKEIKKEMEKQVWQSQKTGSTGLFDGYLYILDNDAAVIDVNIASGSTAYDAVWAVINAIPSEILATEGLCVRVSPLVFRKLCKNLTDMNMYHYSADMNKGEIIMPGTNIPVIMTEGLADATGHKERKIVATYEKNRYVGCDMIDDQEQVSAWYSKDNQTFRIAAEWNIGVNVAFPDLVVLGSMAADPADVVNLGAQVAELAAASHVYKTKEQN